MFSRIVCRFIYRFKCLIKCRCKFLIKYRFKCHFKIRLGFSKKHFFKWHKKCYSIVPHKEFLHTFLWFFISKNLLFIKNSTYSLLFSSVKIWKETTLNNIFTFSFFHFSTTKSKTKKIIRFDWWKKFEYSAKKSNIHCSN